MIRFEYATDTLDPVIPHALTGGLGGKTIDAIRDFENAYGRFCDGKVDQFKLLFADVMSTHDGEGWSLERVRRELDTRLADLTGMPA